MFARSSLQCRSASKELSKVARDSVFKQGNCLRSTEVCRLQDAVRQRRSLHTVPLLPNVSQYEKEGLGRIYSKEGFHMAWTERQTFLVYNYNELVAGTKFQDAKPIDVVIMTAHQAENASIFNHASALVNNHYFFETLCPKSQPEAERPTSLTQLVIGSFDSYENLRQSMLATAMACFSNAFVWLVQDDNLRLRILTTYNAGTPHGGSARRQSVDSNTTEQSYMREMTAANQAALMGGRLPDDQIRRVLLGVNVWEHAYLMNFGIGGKARYLNTWWQHIDWSVVGSRIGNHSGSRVMIRQ